MNRRDVLKSSALLPIFPTSLLTAKNEKKNTPPRPDIKRLSVGETILLIKNCLIKPINGQFNIFTSQKWKLIYFTNKELTIFRPFDIGFINSLKICVTERLNRNYLPIICQGHDIGSIISDNIFNIVVNWEFWANDWYFESWNKRWDYSQKNKRDINLYSKATHVISDKPTLYF